MNLETNPDGVRRLLAAGGAELVKTMVRLFLENTPKRIAAAMDGARRGDWSAVERAGHSMRASAGHLGLTGLVEQAARIEELAAQGRGNEALPLLQEVSAALPTLQTVLRKIADAL